MTIDAPLMFCWAAATYFAAVAIFDQKNWAWVAVGIFAGLGILAKYAMFLWIPSLFGFVWSDAQKRRLPHQTPPLRYSEGADRPRAESGSSAYLRPGVRKSGPIVATVIALLFTIPVIVWNSQHGWVSLKHVAHQTGASNGGLSHGNFLELIGSQIAALDPFVAAIILFAIVYALRLRDDPNTRQMRLLVWIGVPFFLLTVLSSLFAKAQANWPAPAYLSLLILAAYFLATHMRWREFGTGGKAGCGPRSPSASSLRRWREILR